MSLFALLKKYGWPPRRFGGIKRQHKKITPQHRSIGAIGNDTPHDPENTPQKLELKFRALLDAIPTGVLALDTNGIIVRANVAAERLLGQSAAQLLHTRLVDRIIPEQHEDFCSFLSTPKAESTGRDFAFLRQGRDSTLCEVTARPSQEGIIVVLRDVSESRATEDALRKAKEAAESASRAKSDFLTNMSHEIRTPMNGIIGMTSLALETSLDSVQREYLETVKKSSDLLLEILNDILDLSKIEAERVTLERVPFKLRELLEKVVAVLVGRFSHNRTTEFFVSVDPGVPDTLIGDPGKIRQVLINLIGNAQKFTDAGHVTLSIRTYAAERPYLEFSVEDSGIGIPPAKLDTIFEAFSQADSSTTRVYGGTGLGLTISRKLARLMGGDIQVRSVIGQGSTFSFTTPAISTITESDARRGEPHTRLTGRRVLVVEPSTRSRAIIQQIFQSRTAAIVQYASTARVAIALCERALAAKERIDFALLSYQLPDGDGTELAAAIGKLMATQKPSILMLARASELARSGQCDASIITGLVMKPILPGQLLDALSALAKSAGLISQAYSVHQSPSEQSQKVLDILVAEDNAVNQRLIQKLLEKRGHKVTIVPNGQVALETLEQRGNFAARSENGETDLSGFDLVLMDLQMPVMSGLQAISETRKREQSTGRHVPIVALTAHALKQHEEEARNLGADDYITKPIDTARLDAVLRR